MNNQYRILLDREGAGSREFSLGEVGTRPLMHDPILEILGESNVHHHMKNRDFFSFLKLAQSLGPDQAKR